MEGREQHRLLRVVIGGEGKQHVPPLLQRVVAGLQLRGQRFFTDGLAWVGWQPPETQKSPYRLPCPVCRLRPETGGIEQAQIHQVADAKNADLRRLLAEVLDDDEQIGFELEEKLLRVGPDCHVPVFQVAGVGREAVPGNVAEAVQQGKH